MGQVMFALKLVGVILLITSSSLYGFSLGNCYITRIANLKELHKSMILLDGELMYNKTPLRIAMKKMAARTESIYSEFFLYIAEIMEKDYALDITGAWETAVNKVISEKYCLKEKDKSKFLEFGKSIGNRDDNTRKASFENYFLELNLDIEEALKEKDNKVMIYRTMGVMAGMFISIIIV